MFRVALARTNLKVRLAASRADTQSIKKQKATEDIAPLWLRARLSFKQSCGAAP